MTIKQAQELATKIEGIVRPLKAHVGLTGSALYGQGTGKDVDIIIYPHTEVEEGAPKGNARSIWVKRIVEVLIGTFGPLQKLEREYTGKTVYITTGFEQRIDFIFLDA